MDRPHRSQLHFWPLTVAKFKRFWRLCWPDKKLLLAAMGLLFATRLVFWLLPFSLIRRRFRRIFDGQGDKVILRGSTGARILWAVESASRFLPGAGHCLTKAVAAKILLNRAGYRVNFLIGVDRSGHGKLEAHAWLESGGNVVLGNLYDLHRYKAFQSLEI